MADMLAQPPDQRQFHKDVQGGAFVLGGCRGRWRLLSVDWPNACIEIAAAPREGAPSHYTLRFDLTGYPQIAPTARLWDVASNAPLAEDRWPAGRVRVPAAFRSINEWPKFCLYLPCDRISAEGHPDWPNNYPNEIWKPGCDIAHYLNQVSELLTSSDYSGWRHA